MTKDQAHTVLQALPIINSMLIDQIQAGRVGKQRAVTYEKFIEELSLKCTHALQLQEYQMILN